MLNLRMSGAVSAALVILGVAMPATAGTASADPSSEFANAVTTIRAASQCHPLNNDPLAARVAEMATQETSDYLAYRSAQVPFTDPVPALNTIGNPAEKAVMLSGYGMTAADAIKGPAMQDAWWKAISDCSYGQYGISARIHDNGAVLTALVLAAG